MNTLGLDDSVKMKGCVSIHSGFHVYMAGREREEIRINALEIAYHVVFVYDVPTNTPITKAQLMLTKNRKNNILC
jgi:hypothetical protein